MKMKKRIRKWRKPNVFELKLTKMTKMWNGEKLRDQNKSNFSYGIKPILPKQLRDQKCSLAFFLYSYLLHVVDITSDMRFIYRFRATSFNYSTHMYIYIFFINMILLSFKKHDTCLLHPHAYGAYISSWFANLMSRIIHNLKFNLFI